VLITAEETIPMKAITWKVNYARLALCILLGVVAAGSYRAIRGQATPSQTAILARGAGTGILEGGTGAPNYLPVLTNAAFHVELVDGVITGDFECVALGPRNNAGATSGEFTSNVMYVTGTVETAVVQGDTIRITGNSDCTGIGAGENLPFTVEIPSRES
jgi:hypothetical protein